MRLSGAQPHHTISPGVEAESEVVVPSLIQCYT